MTRPAPAALLVALLFLPICPADATDVCNGWRGNGTGLWPAAHPPLEWSRIPRSVAADLRCCADMQDDKNVATAPPLQNGIIRDWLAIGPFAVKDSVRDFNDAQLTGEAAVKPTAGTRGGDLAWKPFTAQLDDRWLFGTATLPVANLADAVGGFKPNQIAYAHTYICSPNGGRVRAVVEHAHGLKVWLNGKELYNAPERGGGMGNYYAFSRVEFSQWDVSASPSFELDLKPGWNRLLLKVGTYNKANSGWEQQQFCMRLVDLPGVAYDSKNILWMTELPQRSNATPIVVGDRIFVMAEPDELLCLDKKTGKVLWTAANNLYEAMTPAERAANPAFHDKVDPLLAEIKHESDIKKRLNLRNKLQKTFTGIDFDRFAWKADEHFEAHFGIVGFTTPTPVSDGKYVWVWCGNGVAARYDLDGNRKWITRVKCKELSYASAPSLAGGVLGVFLNRLVGLDAETGKVCWEQKKIDINVGAIMAAKLGDTPVFITSIGHIVRAGDGHILYRERGLEGGKSSWAPPVILGDVVYLPRFGVKQLLVLDFTGAAGDKWEPKRTTIEVPEGTGRNPEGRMVDRPSPGSPLVVDDLAYMVDIYSTLYVFDLKAKKMLYAQDTDLNGLFHYNAVPVAASPTLIGDHVVIHDNQGTALVLEPGRTFKQVRKNRIGTEIDRWWPVPQQETVSYAPPVCDGDRLYIRGERYLYCIGEK